MKKIEAFIRHEALDAVRARLEDMGLPSMSISEVKGSGRKGRITAEDIQKFTQSVMSGTTQTQAQAKTLLSVSF